MIFMHEKITPIEVEKLSSPAEIYEQFENFCFDADGAKDIRGIYKIHLDERAPYPELFFFEFIDGSFWALFERDEIKTDNIKDVISWLIEQAI